MVVHVNWNQAKESAWEAERSDLLSSLQERHASTVADIKAAHAREMSSAKDREWRCWVNGEWGLAAV